MHACQRCYSRKSKCDRRLPQCSSCVRSHQTCQYLNKRHNRHMGQDYARMVENRLRTLENENEQLKSCLALQFPAQTHQEPAPPDRLTIAGEGLHGAPNHATQNRDFPETPVSTGCNYLESQPAQHESSARSIQRLPGEEPRYLGSSNGADFVRVVERVVDSSRNGRLFQRAVDRQSIADAAALRPIPSQHQVYVLIDQEIAMPLISAYFDHWHLTFPLLYRPAFMEMVQCMYTHADFYSNNPDCAFVFDIVLALGLVTSKKFEWSFCDTESHFSRASARLDSLSRLPDIRSLQALLLCCEYGIHGSLRDTSNEIWHLLTKATSLCVELGLHRDSGTSIRKCRTHLTGPMPPSVQLEMQRRCFWCYHNLERIVSITLGRPLSIHEDDINVSLPSHLPDQSLDSANVTPPSSVENSTSPFVQHIRLRKIQAKIHRLIYTSRTTPSLPLETKKEIRKELFDELETWAKQVSLLQLPSKDNPTVISSGFLHPSWYEALYHSACLLLYRPSPTFPAVTSLDADQDDDDVLQIIWQSSRNVLARYLEVLRARRLNYSWVCLYTIFMAGLANVYSVGRCAQGRKRRVITFLPPYLDVISDVRDCSNILTAICERWDDVRSSCEIFDQLSMSALKELITVSSRPDGEKSVPKSRQSTTSSSAANPSLCQVAPADGPSLSLDAGTEIVPNFSTDEQMQNQSTFDCPSETNDILGFQDLFQDMQSSVHGLDDFYGQSNEVMLGFSQGWFSR